MSPYIKCFVPIVALICLGWVNYQKVMSEELRGRKFIDVNGQFVCRCCFTFIFSRGVMEVRGLTV